jgi:tetratricopeptide (TPR) repeat protein
MSLLRWGRPSGVATFFGAAVALAACSHAGTPPPSGPGARFQAEAARLAEVQFEDQFIEARLVLQALPPGSPQRPPLREKLVRYLLGPLAPLDAERLRREAREIDSDDVYDRVHESLRDAAALYEPSDLTKTPPAISAAERQLLAHAARLVVALFSPRGAEPQVALALAVLASVNPESPEWTERSERLLAWIDEASTAATESSMPRRGASSVDVLQVVLADFPSPAAADRLAALYSDRQQRFSTILKQPLSGGDDARRALGELLSRGDERTVANVASVYLRCDRPDRALTAVAPLADKPGDDPELRAMITAATAKGAPSAAYLRLARRFLPRVEQLGGTATDNPEPVVAFRVLEVGLARAGGDVEMLVLSAQLAKLLSAPFVAIRRLEEAQTLLERDRSSTAAELSARVAADLLELYFLRLRLALDPERAAPPPEAEVNRLRQVSADARRRFQNAPIKIKEAQIDFELGRSYVNAGLIDRAEPLFLRAQGEDSEPNAEITAELASLVMKRGNPRRASQILHDGIQALRSSPEKQETIGGVEGRSKLEKLLGDSLDVAGDRSGAELAWRSAISGWERLMVEHLRRKSFTRSAEATFEIGRLLYLLGRRAEGIQKFDEAIEQDSDRDQSYIDALAFLVQQGEVDAALSIYRRALARADRSVSEYVKVYASLWILDLSRRTQKLPDGAAEAFLRTLDLRHPEIRPQRGAVWYRRLAAFAVGKLGYRELTAAADTPGKQAEVYFYRSMQLLGDGKTDDAHQLWQKVVDTRMFSFFEFDMASRYLRLGAPSAPPAPSQSGSPTETI